MESRIKVFGHPAHQLIVPFPIGAFGLSVAMDTCYSFTHNRQHAKAAHQALDFGLLTSAAAVPVGLVDLLAIPSGTRAKRIGVTHALGNVVMVGLFATSRLLRRSRETSKAARYLSGAAFALSGLTAWLGGELVVRHAIGVSNGAHPSARRLVEASQVPALSEAPTLADAIQAASPEGDNREQPVNEGEQPGIVDWGKRA